MLFLLYGQLSPVYLAKYKLFYIQYMEFNRNCQLQYVDVTMVLSIATCMNPSAHTGYM